MPARSPARWRPHLKLMLAIGSVLVAIGLLTAFLAMQQQSPTEPPAVPPAAATPLPTAPASASPIAIDWPPGSLPALLSMAPDWLGDDPGLPIQATYADVAGWLRARDLDPGALDAATFQEAVAPLPLPAPVRAGGMTAAWRDAYGFDLREVDAILAVGQAPDLVLIMPGRYDPGTLYTTWVANGYQAVEVEEITVWSLAPGDRIDLTAPASRPALGLLNTVVVLDDGTLIATPRPSLMASTLRAIHGKSGSLAAHDGLRPALSQSVDALAAILATGELLAPSGGGVGAPRSPAAAGMLPEVDLVLFTVPPELGPVRMTLVLDQAVDDPAALRRAVRERVAADPAWAARWTVEDLRVTGPDRQLEITVSADPPRDAALDLADPRELEPFRWSSPD